MAGPLFPDGTWVCDQHVLTKEVIQGIPKPLMTRDGWVFLHGQSTRRNKVVLCLVACACPKSDVKMSFSAIQPNLLRSEYCVQCAEKLALVWVGCFTPSDAVLHSPSLWSLVAVFWIPFFNTSPHVSSSLCSPCIPPQTSVSQRAKPLKTTQRNLSWQFPVSLLQHSTPPKATLVAASFPPFMVAPACTLCSFFFHDTD